MDKADVEGRLWKAVVELEGLEPIGTRPAPSGASDLGAYQDYAGERWDERWDELTETYVPLVAQILLARNRRALKRVLATEQGHFFVERACRELMLSNRPLERRDEAAAAMAWAAGRSPRLLLVKRNAILCLYASRSREVEPLARWRGWFVGRRVVDRAMRAAREAAGTTYNGFAFSDQVAELEDLERDARWFGLSDLAASLEQAVRPLRARLDEAVAARDECNRAVLNSAARASG